LEEDETTINAIDQLNWNLKDTGVVRYDVHALPEETNGIGSILMNDEELPRISSYNVQLNPG
jgi:hypothetical protein